MSAEISVVTPTHRRPDLLERLLASLARQTVGAEAFEIIVVDDGSKDDTTEVLTRAAAEASNLRFVTNDPGRGPASARNAGVALANAPLILFLDDDVEADDDLIATHLGLHAAGDESLGILGRVDWHPSLDITPFMRWLDSTGLQFAFDTWLREGPIDPPYAAFYTANLSMHKSLFERSGGFDERFPYPAYEDMELAWRLAKLGFRMDYRPKAHVFHTRAIDLVTFKRRMAKVAESAVLLTAVQPDFPIDPQHTPERWPVPSATRRRLLSVWTRFIRDDRLHRFYRGEIAAAYRDGLERGRAALSERNLTPSA